jgi:hypothetical protein
MGRSSTIPASGTRNWKAATPDLGPAPCLSGMGPFHGMEFAGFPNVGRLAGTVRFDVAARRMHVTPATEPDQPPPETIDYAYEINGDELTLVGGDEVSISFERHRVTQHPLANAHVEFVAADGINDAGELLVTEFTALEAGRASAIYFQPVSRSLATGEATVFLVQENGLKEVTLDDARRLIRESMPVVVAYRQDDRPPWEGLHELWKEVGPPMPESDAVAGTFFRLLRPGTLVFVLSARENLPVP